MEAAHGTDQCRNDGVVESDERVAIVIVDGSPAIVGWARRDGSGFVHPQPSARAGRSRRFFTEHRNEVRHARIVPGLHEERRHLASMMGLVVNRCNAGHQSGCSYVTPFRM